MPRITESTVNEHRQRMLTEILDAVEDILKTEGRQQLTMSAVSQRTGIARNSLYRYASNADRLCDMVLARRLPTWSEALQRALDGLNDPKDIIEAWCLVNLQQASEHGHGWLMDLFSSSQHGRLRKTFLYADPHNTQSIQSSHSRSQTQDTAAELPLLHFHQLVNGPLIEAWMLLLPNRTQIGIELTRGLVQSGMRLIDSAQSNPQRQSQESINSIVSSVIASVHTVVETLTSQAD